MECKLVAGQKVVCAADAFELALGRLSSPCACMEWPTPGAHYTIRDVHLLGPSFIGVHLNEIVNGSCFAWPDNGEPDYPHHWFKPLEHAGMTTLREIAENPKPIPGELVPAPKKREVEKV